MMLVSGLGILDHVIVYMAATGITLAQNFRATSRRRPDYLERCFNTQGDTRLHVAAVLTR